MKHLTLLFTALLIALAGCGQSNAGTGTTTDTSATATTTTAKPQDRAQLIEQLQTAGLTVEEQGPAQQPFLTGEGTTLHLSGGKLAAPADLSVFEYASADAAMSEAATIGPDGSPSTMMISWIEPPHFFVEGKLIVLYLGSDQELRNLLTTLLNPQFAGLE